MAVQLKSDLSIPEHSSKFITLYLLFSIGFRGGQELAHSSMDAEMIGTLAAGILASALVPLYTFYLLKRKLGIENAGAIAASYGSVSAVTFITAVAFLETHQIHFGGHMVAVMASMEAPAIVTGMLLISLHREKQAHEIPISQTVKHAFTNGRSEERL